MDFEKQMKEKGASTEGGKTKKIASPMIRSLSPSGGRDEQSSAAAGSMLSKMGGDKVDVTNFKSRKIEREKKAKMQEAIETNADPNSPSMKAGGFVRLANQKGQAGNMFASPSHILNPGVARDNEEVKKEPV